jgi:hypothetical protein
MGAITSYTFTNVGANHTIKATFLLKEVTRYSGGTVSNALSAARFSYPNWTGVTHVVIASADTLLKNQYEAATAPGLAGAYKAPLLLVSPSTLRTDVRDALVEMPDGVKVHIVGGTQGVSTNVFNAIKATPGVASVERITGADQYETAVAVAHKMKAVLGANFPTTVLVADGERSGDLPGAVGASVVSARMGMPLLYVKVNAVPPTTGAAFWELGFTERYVIGGTGSVSEIVRIAVGAPSANRIGGADWGTVLASFAQLAKDKAWLPGTHFGVAAKAQDANWSGAYLAVRGGPFLLVTRYYVTTPTATYLTTNKAGILKGYVFGSTTLVSESVRTSLLNVIK